MAHASRGAPRRSPRVALADAPFVAVVIGTPDADIFRDFGPAWLEANGGHVSHAQLKVMDAIVACRTAALGGFVARCENPECAHTVISYCSCSNRHCPKCQGNQALAWMA